MHGVQRQVGRQAGCEERALAHKASGLERTSVYWTLLAGSAAAYRRAARAGGAAHVHSEVTCRAAHVHSEVGHPNPRPPFLPKDPCSGRADGRGFSCGREEIEQRQEEMGEEGDKELAKRSE
eukprot:2013135-Rhodomonas_salina.1